MSYAGAMGALVRLTGWPLKEVMWGVSVRALVLLSSGIAESYAPTEKELL